MVILGKSPDRWQEPCVQALPRLPHPGSQPMSCSSDSRPVIGSPSIPSEAGSGRSVALAAAGRSRRSRSAGRRSRSWRGSRTTGGNSSPRPTTSRWFVRVRSTLSGSDGQDSARRRGGATGASSPAAASGIGSYRWRVRSARVPSCWEGGPPARWDSSGCGGCGAAPATPFRRGLAGSASGAPPGAGTRSAQRAAIASAPSASALGTDSTCSQARRRVIRTALRTSSTVAPSADAIGTEGCG